MESQGDTCDLRGTSRALCALEVLANVNELAGDYVVTPIELPGDIAIITLTVDDLPPEWNAARPIFPKQPILAQPGPRRSRVRFLWFLQP